MEGNPSHPRRKKRTHKTGPSRSLSSASESSSSSTSSTTQSSSSSSRSRSRFSGTAARTVTVDEAEECSVECSGQSCQACSAALVADCVALCCCPLAVVSLLACAFIKVPYIMGRRCLGRRKRKEKEKRKLCINNRKDSIGFGCSNETVNVDDIVFEFGEDETMEQRRSLCTGFIEVDNVLLELYQVGHLGFGRVSFTGIQPNGKAT